MRKVMEFIRRIGRAEEGQSLVEYGLIIALIAVVVIGAVALIGTNLTGLFNHIASNVAVNAAG